MERNRLKFYYLAAYGLMMTANVIGAVAGAGIATDRAPQFQLLSSCVTLPALLASIALALVWNYRVWAAVGAEHRRLAVGAAPGPGAAVFLCLLPLFNAIWGVAFHTGLVASINDRLPKRSPARASMGWAIAYAMAGGLPAFLVPVVWVVLLVTTLNSSMGSLWVTALVLPTGCGLLLAPFFRFVHMRRVDEALVAIDAGEGVRDVAEVFA